MFKLTYEAALETLKQMGNVVESLYEKVTLSFLGCIHNLSPVVDPYFFLF